MAVYDVNYPWWHPSQRIAVYLNGECVKNCFYADTDRGIVRCYDDPHQRDETGLALKSHEKHGIVTVVVSPKLKAFQYEDDIFAATDRTQAYRFALELAGGDPDDVPFDEKDFYELTDEQLDREIIEFDSNECETGDTTTIRSWLATAEPGWLAGPNG